ncbi:MULTISPECIES: hypothetical protein [Leptospira]|uniref:Uncharacterized protein n=1 Tax=Leptospira weilii str. UI 13098 TaxID=1088542 RepID=M6Q5N8_9LEPT|nr:MULTISPECIES: hypothetical protein [Leptospira]EMJ64559.1 hypothetical protein LEP1GSC051_2113 [Leptospira sp. P2653]EMN90599.1 hypothetical protein LEP1GSC108_3349 [Leptospira weilii str. UI 13098]OMI16699.1 hypothetical protein BUQ74_13990 [Leptospira weilii serovar Heyan]ULH29234.1 hypothetical protein FH586_04770 [Leptospira weilii]UPY81134.1 hypothetical protein FH581_023050 [Leptospira weilii]
MNTEYKIQPIEANFLVVKMDEKEYPLPVLVYKVENENYVYAEILNYSILGYGNSIQEAKEDIVNLIDLYLHDSKNSDKPSSIIQSETEKRQIFLSLIDIKMWDFFFNLNTPKQEDIKGQLESHFAIAS